MASLLIKKFLAGLNLKVFGQMSLNEARRATQPAFRTASYCAAGECVEVAQGDGVVILRDSTQPLGSRLRYGARDWGSFVRDVKSGKLDRLGS